MTEILRDTSTLVGMTVKGSRELFKKSEIILRKQTDVRDVEQDHGEPIHAEAERVTAPLFGIVSFIAAGFVDRFEDGGVDYAATAHLDPLLATLERLGFHIDFQARFGERKMVRTKLDLGFCTKQHA